jgi:hypothetical protein
MPLCDPCQTVIDKDALSVLVRRDDFGRSILCHLCRQQIFSENSKFEKGHRSFVFENPTKTLTPTPTQTSTQTPIQTCTQSPTQTSAADTVWYCKRCSARVWAKPRAFLGNIEPQGWWLCRTCIIEDERDKLDDSYNNAMKSIIKENVHKKNKYD